MVKETIKDIRINPNTMILVVSDVHLGASKGNLKLFNNFLEYIISKKKEGNLENLKALILLGDIFDFITESYKDFGTKDDYIETFNSLDILHDRNDIELLFCLGNHEIDTTGDYDSNFEDRKVHVIDDFNINVQNHKFLQYENCFQYIFLHDSKMRLYDSIDDILIDDIKKERYLAVDLKDKTFLLTHGYQFDPLLKIWSIFWLIGLSNPYDLFKELNDAAWNDLIKPVLDTFNELKEIIDISKEKSIEKKLTKLMTKKRRKKKDLKFVSEFLANSRRDNIQKVGPTDKNSFIRKILDEFLPKYKEIKGRPSITHIIFGHTHDAYDACDFNTNNGKISIMNCGAWQQVDLPSFIEISTDFKITLAKIK